MFVPTLYHDNIFDDFDNFFGLMDMPQRRDPLFGKRADRMMRTDVRETETGYELDIDLPGFKKEDVKAELKDGYLTRPDEARKDARRGSTPLWAPPRLQRIALPLLLRG